MTAAEASGEAGGGESAAHRAAESAGGGHRETAAEHAKESRLLGVDTESTPLVILAVLDRLAAQRPGRQRLRCRAAILLRLRVVSVTITRSPMLRTATDPGSRTPTCGGHPRVAPRALGAGSDVDVVVVSPHWGPNIRAAPVAHVRRTATAPWRRRGRR
jgi:hypothetical protein